ncbi:hypothetical protein [Streptomyces sp. JNUCC 63]
MSLPLESERLLPPLAGRHSTALAAIHQLVQQGHEGVDVRHAQPGRGLVEHVDRSGAAQVTDGFQPPALTARQRAQRLPQGETPQADLQEPGQSVVHVALGEGRDGVLRGHLQDIRGGLAAQRVRQYVVLEPASPTGLTARPHGVRAGDGDDLTATPAILAGARGVEAEQ